MTELAPPPSHDNVLGDGECDDSEGISDADRWVLALEAGRIGVWQWDISTNEVWWSHRMHAMTDVPADEFGRTMEGFVAAIDPEDRPEMRQSLEAVLHTRQTLHLELRVASPSGDTRWIETRGMAVNDVGGTPTSVIGTAIDITDRKRSEAGREALLRDEQQARSQAEASRERLSFLIRAGREVRAVLDPTVVRQTAADLAVPDLGDWALVIGADGATVHAWAGSDFDHADAGTGAANGYRVLGSPEMLRQVAETGEPQVVATQTLLTVGADEDPTVSMELSAASVAAVRLVNGRQMLGMLVIGHHRSTRPFDPDDVALLREYAGTVAAAIDKAVVFEERSAIARVLQQSLLPASLPTVDGIEIETEYHPAGEGLIVGGDFYDVFRISEGRYGFAVGDVSGKGSEAAAVTALVRHSIRAFAETHDDPADVLVAVNEAIRIHGPSLRYCTAVYGVLTLSGAGPTSRVDATVAVGGHPLPILLRSNGEAEYVGEPGTLLGMFPDVGVKASAQPLEPGDALILYTDGVPDCRRAGEPFGDQRMRSVLTDAAGESAAAIAGRLGAAILDYHDEPSDDIALLVIRRCP